MVSPCFLHGWKRSPLGRAVVPKAYAIRRYIDAVTEAEEAYAIRRYINAVTEAEEAYAIRRYINAVTEAEKAYAIRRYMNAIAEALRRMLYAATYIIITHVTRARLNPVLSGSGGFVKRTEGHGKHVSARLDRNAGVETGEGGDLIQTVGERVAVDAKLVGGETPR